MMSFISFHLSFAKNMDFKPSLHKCSKFWCATIFGEHESTVKGLIRYTRILPQIMYKMWIFHAQIFMNMLVLVSSSHCSI